MAQYGMLHAKNGIKLEDAEFFAVVARRLHFGQAARELGVPASTLSRRVAALEEALGQRLIQRTSRRVGLTADGERLLARSGHLLGELRGVLDDSEGSDAEPAGRLRVTAPLQTGAERVGPALFAFAARYPRVELELRLTNAFVDLVEEGFDLAFRLGPIADGEMVARRLWSAPYALAASPRVVRDALGGKTSLSRARVAELPFVLTRALGTVKLLRKDGSVDEFSPPARFVVNDPRLSIMAAVEGLGVVAAPCDSLEKQGKRLVEISVRDRRVPPREIFAVYPSRRFLPARVRLALEWVQRQGVARD